MHSHVNDADVPFDGTTGPGTTSTPASDDDVRPDEQHAQPRSDW
ncbi:hypothetical protein EDF64_11230 [Curtobacterium flaccumfaciens]|uniref:Uncharacterized protein n=1 Tax=Curtobacterium flaccumfaciens TaxID=2035 RepID=A0A4R6DCW5_9MICO|nr:hypothetical protein EDF64_11230 [Curtobacterium flaccumfaciens]